MGVCIALNTIILALDHHPIDYRFALTIEYSNLVFYFVFVIECIIENLAYGFRGYIADKGN